jgi:hypothetical protein
MLKVLRLHMRALADAVAPKFTADLEETMEGIRRGDGVVKAMAGWIAMTMKVVATNKMRPVIFPCFVRVLSRNESFGKEQEFLQIIVSRKLFKKS